MMSLKVKFGKNFQIAILPLDQVQKSLLLHLTFMILSYFSKVLEYLLSLSSYLPTILGYEIYLFEDSFLTNAFIQEYSEYF